jgi:hypothetical protein
MRHAILSVALLTIARTASACGVCIEDRVAAVYDYQIEQEAARQGMSIVYLAVEGPRAESTAAATAVAAALRADPITLADSVRTSVSPAAASVTWRGDTRGLQAALRSANERLAPSGLKLELLRTWDARSGLH